MAICNRHCIGAGRYIAQVLCALSAGPFKHVRRCAATGCQVNRAVALAAQGRRGSSGGCYRNLCYGSRTGHRSDASTGNGRHALQSIGTRLCHLENIGVVAGGNGRLRGAIDAVNKCPGGISREVYG